MKLVRKILPFLAMAMLFALPAFSQTGNISGKVIDTDGKPVTGATIPGFSSQTHRSRLAVLHEAIAAHGPLIARLHGFWLEALRTPG